MTSQPVHRNGQNRSEDFQNICPGRYPDFDTPPGSSKLPGICPNCPVTKYSPANTGGRYRAVLPELPARSNCPAARLYRTGSGQTQKFSMARKVIMTQTAPIKHLTGKP